MTTLGNMVLFTGKQRNVLIPHYSADEGFEEKQKKSLVTKQKLFPAY